MQDHVPTTPLPRRPSASASGDPGDTPAGLVDGFGRVHDDLRISVTDRCNLRCAYCMPVVPVWFPHGSLLTYEEIERLARLLSGAGVSRIRVTGGEPLVRRDLPSLIRKLAAIDGIRDLSLTTNGVLLGPLARSLAASGLHRINVSLDSLVSERFATLTGRPALRHVLDGLDRAAEAGLGPIKLNAVLLRGINDDEAESLAALGRDRGWEVRFIEAMPLANSGQWDRSGIVPGWEVRARIERLWPLEPDPGADPRAPATRFLYRDGRGAVGFIDSVTRPFCSACARLRLTADGKLRVCLYDDAETDLRGPLRAGADDEAILALVRHALARKTRGGALDLLESPRPPVLVRTMHQIGG